MTETATVERIELTDEDRKDIDERVAELVGEHKLSNAREEAVRLTLEDLATRGEWPPPEDTDGDGVSDEMEAAILELEKARNEIDKANAELEALRKAGAGDDSSSPSRDRMARRIVDQLGRALRWDHRTKQRAAYVLGLR